MLHQVRSDADCAIEQALSVIGDWWSLLIIRSIAGGTVRFDALQAELAVSRKVLTLRLRSLVQDGVLVRERYSERPPRFEYRLSDKGRALLPVLVSLQTWGARYVMGDGTLTATTDEGSTEASRVHQLVGAQVPAVKLVEAGGGFADPVSPDHPWTVLYCFPGAYASAADYAPGWAEIPGTAGCTLEALAFRAAAADFAAAGAAVVGVSTQRPDQLEDLADQLDLPFRLASDQGLELATALRLPTFRAGGDRLKRLTLLIDQDRRIHDVLYPIRDAAQSVDVTLGRVRDRRGNWLDTVAQSR